MDEQLESVCAALLLHSKGWLQDSLQRVDTPAAPGRRAHSWRSRPLRWLSPDTTPQVQWCMGISNRDPSTPAAGGTSALVGRRVGRNPCICRDPVEVQSWALPTTPPFQNVEPLRSVTICWLGGRLCREFRQQKPPRPRFGWAPLQQRTLLWGATLLVGPGHRSTAAHPLWAIPPEWLQPG